MEGVWWELGDIDQASVVNFATFSSGTSEVFIMTLTFKYIDAIYHSDWAQEKNYIIFSFIHRGGNSSLVKLYQFSK